MLQAYDDCGGETLLVSLGSMVGSVSGFVSQQTNILYELIAIVLDHDWQNEVVATINQANETGDPEDWKDAGYYAGAIVA